MKDFSPRRARLSRPSATWIRLTRRCRRHPCPRIHVQPHEQPLQFAKGRKRQQRRHRREIYNGLWVYIPYASTMSAAIATASIQHCSVDCSRCVTNLLVLPYNLCLQCLQCLRYVVSCTMPRRLYFKTAIAIAILYGVVSQHAYRPIHTVESCSSSSSTISAQPLGSASTRWY